MSQYPSQDFLTSNCISSVRCRVQHVCSSFTKVSDRKRQYPSWKIPGSHGHNSTTGWEDREQRTTMTSTTRELKVHLIYLISHVCQQRLIPGIHDVFLPTSCWILWTLLWFHKSYYCEAVKAVVLLNDAFDSLCVLKIINSTATH